MVAIVATQEIVSAMPARNARASPKVQISTWLPSSTTRLVGRLKNSIALSALRSIQANSFSRQIAMPGRDDGEQRLAREEEAGVHHLELRRRNPVTLRERGGHVGLLHEAVAQDEAVEAVAEILAARPASLGAT